MKKILFMGDSVTDCDRGNGLGTGYANLVASKLSFECPGEYEFDNQGIGGNRVVDLLARWKRDCINHKPDYMSILIGVNDVWHEYSWSNGVSAKRFEVIYEMLITDTKMMLPNTKIMLLTPFVIHGGVTDQDWEYFNTEVKKRRDAVFKLAAKFDLPIVDLQEEFDKVCENSKPSFWSADGVHPTPAGHELIKNAWIKGFDLIIKNR